MKLNDVFYSVNGEVNKFHQGSPAIFLRFQGCNLRCAWCDTKQAQEYDNGTEDVSFAQIQEMMDQIAPRCRVVTITGGEPFIHAREMRDFIPFLLKRGYCVSVETNGTFNPRVLIDSDHPNLSYVMDWKLPDSAMTDKMDISNFRSLTKDDFVKFVIASTRDFNTAISIAGQLALLQVSASVAFSPVSGKVSAEELCEWILSAQLPFILNLQMHKHFGWK